MAEICKTKWFKKKLHSRYFSSCLKTLPSDYSSGDTSRMSLVFFSLSGLDLLGTLEDVLSPQDKASYIEWIYSQQVFGIDQHGTLLAGFRGGPYLGPSSSSKHSQTELSI
eukprot:Sdes_comp22208_c0_seq1m20710